MASSQVVGDLHTTAGENGNLTQNVLNILKSRLGNSDDFLSFERHFYYQSEELALAKKNNEKLQILVAKFQEEKRSLEHQLVSEKALREQESKNAAMELEKKGVEQAAQIYSIKCEAESWKRKATAVTEECNFLKQQMKTVESEKNQVLHKLSELKSTISEQERYRHSMDGFARRHKDLIQNSNKRLDEVVEAKEYLAQLTESNEKQLSRMAQHLRLWKEGREASEQKIAELEKELLKAKADLVQATAKLERTEIADNKQANFVEKLIEENKDLQTGLTILTKVVGDQVRVADREFIDKTIKLHNTLDSAAKRLFLDENDFSPQEHQPTITQS